MSSRMSTLDQSLSHCPQDRPAEDTAEIACTEGESEQVNTDEDTERFCAYRNQRYGHSSTRSRSILLRMGQAHVKNVPGLWHFDFEPLGITRPGAENPSDRHSSLDTASIDGEQAPSRGERDRLLGLQNLSPRSGRRRSDTPISPRSRRVANTTTDVRRRSTQGNDDQNLDSSAAISTVGNSLGGSYKSSTHEARTPAPRLDPKQRKGNLEPNNHELGNAGTEQDARYFMPKKKWDQVDYAPAEGTRFHECIAKLLMEADGITTMHARHHSAVQVISELEYMAENRRLDLDYVGLGVNSGKLPANETGFAELEQIVAWRGTTFSRFGQELRRKDNPATQSI
ncbi:hypothetical protein VMCG_06408 [Cytospora schulzeri]|uniref:Uncharacterized protein n=1 Tax=Cytospora schulzeri TaxID=448051 RepID=A0A423W7T8_9PEZI|nr:hypothetical protein VMCG_06408 [Valsa malicola]